MESFNFKIELNDEQKAYRQKNIEFCMQDEDVLDFIHDYELDQSFVEKHSSLLKKWAETMKTCKKCSGLDACVFNRGKRLELEMDEDCLIQIYRKCDYLKDEEKKNEYLNHYVYFHGSHEMMIREFSSVDLSKNDKRELMMMCKELTSSVSESRGIYLYGKPGCGKTYLMNCLAHLYVKSGSKVAFVNVPTLISELKNGFGVSGFVESKMHLLQEVDVLFLDDIGGESLTGWSRDEILMPLLNLRMEKKLKTYFTSNYSFDELESHLSIDSRGNVDKIKGNRLMERIVALSCEKNLKGINRRQI